VNIMQGFMNCVIAPYFVGMFWDRLSANACILGCFIGIIVLFITEMELYQKRQMTPEEMWMGKVEVLSSFWSLFASSLASVFFTWIFAVVAPHLNDDDNKFFKWDYIGDVEAERFGKNRCNMASIKEACAGDKQPSDSWLGWGLFLFSVAAPCLALPWGKEEFKDEGMGATFPQWAFDLFITSIFAGIAIFFMNAFCYKPELDGAETKTVIWAKESGAGSLGPAQLARRMSQELLENPESPFSKSKSPGFNQVLPNQLQDVSDAEASQTSAAEPVK